MTRQLNEPHIYLAPRLYTLDTYSKEVQECPKHCIISTYDSASALII